MTEMKFHKCDDCHLYRQCFYATDKGKKLKLICNDCFEKRTPWNSKPSTDKKYIDLDEYEKSSAEHRKPLYTKLKNKTKKVTPKCIVEDMAKKSLKKILKGVEKK